MPHSTPFTLGLLVGALAVLGAGCATNSGGRESEGGPPGGPGPGRRMARQDRQQQELWKQYDLHRDDKITREEFMAVRAVCFARYDAHGTGVLTRAEVMRFFPPQLADRINAAFSRLDLDGDGLISREEFDRESARLFQQADTNRIGVIAGTDLSGLNAALRDDLCQPSGSPGRR